MRVSREQELINDPRLSVRCGSVLMRDGSADHAFGSQSTDLKLEVIERYLAFFTTALRGKFPRLWYIDAFAGTGNRTVEHKAVAADMLRGAQDQRIEQRRGSATIALETEPHFDRLIFIEKKKKHWQALKDLAAKHPARRIDVFRGDANAELLELIEGQRWAGTRAVLFLDPYGMHVDWTTLEAIRRTEAIDVWYLVSLEGLFRQAARDHAKLTDYKRAKVTAMVGCDDWEAEWYPTGPVDDLFSLMTGEGLPQGGARRTATIGEMEAFFKRRLESLFPKVCKPLRLKNKGGVETFSLFFAASNPDPAAYGLATKIAAYILNSGISSQVRP